MDNIPSITVRMQSGHKFQFDGPQAALIQKRLNDLTAAPIFLAFEGDLAAEAMIVPQYVESYEWYPHGNADTVLRRPISDLNISARTLNCLLEASITTIGELTNCTEGDLSIVPNLGAKSIAKIDDALADTYGLGLAYV